MAQQSYHASCVAIDGRAVVIVGDAGTGKSTLAMELITRGATLIADDQTLLTRDDDGLTASCPSSIRGQIEARNIGILRCPTVSDVPVGLVIDMGHAEMQRLPIARTIDLAGIDLPLLYRVDGPQFAPAIILLMKFGRLDP